MTTDLSALWSHIFWGIVTGEDVDWAQSQCSNTLCLRCSDLHLDKLMDKAYAGSIFSDQNMQRLGNMIMVADLTLGAIDSDYPCPLCQVISKCTAESIAGYLRHTKETTMTFTLALVYSSPWEPPWQGGVFYFGSRDLERGTFHICNTAVDMVVHHPNPKFDQHYRELPTKANLTVLKQWIENCQDDHADCFLENHEDWTPNFQMSLINCETRIVQARGKGDNYVALSYVWGDDTSEVREGSASIPDPAPKLVEDAIEVTKAIGLKYLWIDRYCISKAEAVKLTQLKTMDEVYRHADLTIVSLGPNPSYGLPGVKNKLRTPKPSARIGDYLFTPAALQDPHLCVLDSKCNTRGWTFQEGTLSRRGVCFTEEQMYFECKEEHLCENTVMPICSASDDEFGQYTAFHSAYSLDVQGLWGLIEQYAKRDLTYREDAINAFSGIFHTFKASCKIQHYWGIPIDVSHRYKAITDEPNSGAERVYSQMFIWGLFLAWAC